MKHFPKPGNILKRVGVVLLLSLLGVTVLAFTLPLMAGATGGSLAGY